MAESKKNPVVFGVMRDGRLYPLPPLKQGKKRGGWREKGADGQPDAQDATMRLLVAQARKMGLSAEQIAAYCSHAALKVPERMAGSETRGVTS